MMAEIEIASESPGADEAASELVANARPPRKRSWLRLMLLTTGIGGMLFVVVVVVGTLISQSMRIQRDRAFARNNVFVDPSSLTNYPQGATRTPSDPMAAPPTYPGIDRLVEQLQGQPEASLLAVQAPYSEPTRPTQTLRNGLPNPSYVQGPYYNGSQPTPYYGTKLAFEPKSPTELLVESLRDPNTAEDAKVQLRSRLMKLLDTEFASKHQQQSQYLDTMTAEIARLKEVLAERMNRKDEIVRQRFIQLIGERDPFRWDYDVESDARPIQTPPTGLPSANVPNFSSPGNSQFQANGSAPVSSLNTLSPPGSGSTGPQLPGPGVSGPGVIGNSGLPGPGSLPPGDNPTLFEPQSANQVAQGQPRSGALRQDQGLNQGLYDNLRSSNGSSSASNSGFLAPSRNPGPPPLRAPKNQSSASRSPNTSGGLRGPGPSQLLNSGSRANTASNRFLNGSRGNGAPRLNNERDVSDTRALIEQLRARNAELEAIIGRNSSELQLPVASSDTESDVQLDLGTAEVGLGAAEVEPGELPTLEEPVEQEPSEPEPIEGESAGDLPPSLPPESTSTESSVSEDDIRAAGTSELSLDGDGTQADAVETTVEEPDRSQNSY